MKSIQTTHTLIGALGAVTSCNISSQTPFRIELTTDSYNHDDTSWEIQDVNNGETIHSVDLYYDPGYEAGSFYNETYCLKTSSCFQFIIRDFFDDGLSSGGSYEIFFDGVSIMSGGGNFGASETSDLFGYGCPSPAPSASTRPTRVKLPTLAPTSSPSSQPSIHPTWSPTQSHVPSFAPSKPVDLIKLDEYNRRYFSHVDQEVDWAGTLYRKPPFCNKRRKRCESGIPKSRQIHSIAEGLQSLNPFETSAVVPINLPSGSKYRESNVVTVADVDNDNFPDIILGNYNSDWKYGQEKDEEYIQLIRNRGDGSFEDPVRLSKKHKGIWATVILSADINNDGWVDVIVGTNEMSNHVFMNKGLGQNAKENEHLFEEPLELPGGMPNTRAMFAADVNNDGMLDIVVGNGSEENQLFINKDGRFLESDMYSLTPANPGNWEVEDTSAVLVLDFNKDGFVDIVFGNWGQRNLILLNNGSGGFKNATYLPGGGSYTTCLAAIDIDNDGLSDIVVGNSGSSFNLGEYNQILRNLGNGTFDTPVDLQNKDITQAIAIADVNNDGAVDIVFANLRQSNKILINRGGNSFEEAFEGEAIDLPSNGLSDASDIAVADFDNDGFIDFVVIDSYEPNQVLFTKLPQGFHNAVNLQEGQKESRAVAVADMNNDGFLDLVFGNFGSIGSVNELLLNDGSGGFSNPISLPSSVDIWQDDRSKTLAVTLGDINDDGRTDIIFGNMEQQNEILINMSGNDFTAVVLPGNSADVSTSIALADIDGDGLLDLVIGNYGSANHILFNKGSKISPSYNTTTDVVQGDRSETLSIAVADMNGDNLMDIVVGNAAGQNNESNELLIQSGRDEQGRITWDRIPLPFFRGEVGTSVIALADMNNDGKIDLVIGNREYQNQLVLNNHNNGTFTEAITLPGGSISNTKSIALGDVNDDGYIDIAIGNDREESLFLLNYHKQEFEELPIARDGVSVRNSQVAFGDLNGDGLLDLILANDGEANMIIPFSHCPDGGARLHRHSWCFKCPSFMGRVVSSTGMETSVCRECPPDHQQQTGTGDQCDMYNPCYLGERQLGTNTCSNRCLDGTFYNSSIIRSEDNPSSWTSPRCQACNVGEFANNSKQPAINFCFKCPPGQYQNSTGSLACNPCPSGTYQPEIGQAKCKKCRKGGYCSSLTSSNGGFTRCYPGTYNDELGSDSVENCKRCPAGTYNVKDGSESIDDCTSCPPGTFNHGIGNSNCTQCSKGEFQELSGQTTCLSCPDGRYSNRKGSRLCTKCPYPLSSFNGSNICTICDRGFFLNAKNASNEDIFSAPFKYCQPCPANAFCDVNTSILDLPVLRNHWRLSNRTSKIYPCTKSKACIGTRSVQSIQASSGGSHYCDKNHKGQLCESCEDKTFYFNERTGICEKCPQTYLIVLTLALIAGASVMITVMIYHALTKLLSDTIANLSLQAKLKLLISFYQIISSFKEVYGITLSRDITAWADGIFSFLGLDFINIVEILPLRCIFQNTGEMILITALLPYIVILLAAITMSIFVLARRTGNTKTKNNLELEEVDMSLFVERRFIQFTIFVLYISLPSVCRAAFNAIKCKDFQNDDFSDPPSIKSFLLIDMEVECDLSFNEYKTIYVIFWSMLVLWTIFTPSVYIFILHKIRESVQSNSITFLADACRFLWQDYKPDMLYWDVFDTVRKIMLIGFIMFIDIKDGSSKLLRLVVGSLISMTYLGLLLIYNPYKRNNDYILAFMSNLLLLACFSLGVVLKLCSDDGGGTCSAFMSGTIYNSRNASILSFALALSMLNTTIIFIVYLSIQKIRAPVVRMGSNGRKPILELPENCKFHLFASHVWSTGQDQTHSIVRKLQLFMPGIKIWLDVDNLENISHLEDEIAESAVFMLYYSKRYFRSKNCRREVYAAVRLNKPIIVVYGGDESMIDDLKTECRRYCTDDDDYDDDDDELPDAETIIAALTRTSESMSFYSAQNEPIQWIKKDGAFTAAALNRLYYRMLWNLPYYKIHPNELAAGIVVPGEMGKVSFTIPVDVLFYENNNGAEGVLNELQALEGIPDGMIEMYNALEYLREISSEEEDVDSFNTGENEFKDDIIDLSMPIYDKPTFLLVYLNEDTFEETHSNNQTNELITIIKQCKKKGITVVLVHEEDRNKGGCEFSTFFDQAPPEIYKPPWNLFNDLAISIYTNKAYRDVSLKRIAMKLGATLPKWRVFGVSSSVSASTVLHRDDRLRNSGSTQPSFRNSRGSSISSHLNMSPTFFRGLSRHH